MIDDDRAFLAWIKDKAEKREQVSHSDVDRLRRLANWADTAAPPAWDGTLDRGETCRAVEDARKRMMQLV